MALLPPNLSTFSSPPLPAAKPTGIRVVVLSDYIDLTSVATEWPRQFLVPPRVGDMVQSRDGTSKKIIEVIHFEEADGSPALAVRLGNDSTDVTPTSGGSTAEAF